MASTAINIRESFGFIVEHLKWPQYVARYLWIDGVIDGGSFEQLNAIYSRNSPTEKTTFLLVELLKSTKPKVTELFMDALRCTAQSELADKLAAGILSEQNAVADGATSLIGFIHWFSGGRRSDSGLNFTKFKFQTGEDTYVNCETDYPDLHQSVLRDFLGSRIAVRMENMELLPDGIARIRFRSRFYRIPGVEFMRKEPRAEWTTLAEISELPLGSSVNVKARVVRDMPESRPDRKVIVSSSGNELHYSQKVIDDNTAQMKLSIVKEWRDPAELAVGKSYGITNLTIKMYGNEKYLLTSEYTTIKDDVVDWTLVSQRNRRRENNNKN